ncbi:MAG: glycosyltransferase [Bacteroidetes bacterium]|nr:MAG: glycosyltransferase [Bacteroidota bacterium]
MLQGETFFILGLPKHDGPYESTNYTIAKMLAEHNTVYYIDNPYTWKDFATEKNSPQVLKRKKLGLFKKASLGLLSTENPNLHIVVTPLLPSLNFVPEGLVYRNLLNWAETIIRNRIKQIIQAKNIQEYIYINSFNFHYPKVAKGLQPKQTIYYCVDPLVRPFDVKHGLISQQYLIETSDIVLCTSKKLYQDIKPQNDRTYFVPNAADITHSSKALLASTQPNEAVMKIAAPRIGYFGNIERRIDFDMLQQVTQALPQYHFIFVGPVEAEFIPSWFHEQANIHLLGRMPYSEMPGVLKAFDVALLPFKKDEVSATIFPLKLFEYLGAGKPTVAINFNDDLLAFTGNSVPFCSTAQELTKQIQDAYEQRADEQKIQERVAIAQGNTWQQRLELIEKIIVNNIETLPDYAY